MDVMLRKLQNLCEGHNSKLQDFVGEDLSIEGKDFATLLAEFLEEEDLRPSKIYMYTLHITCISIPKAAFASRHSVPSSFSSCEGDLQLCSI